jgi:hypothetical protein
VTETWNWINQIWNWINQNSGGVQAVGSVAAILIAVGVAWFSHWLDVRRSANAQRREDARTLETVAAIVINAMNLIQVAKEQLCDSGEASIEGYRMEVYDKVAFMNAGEALREVPVAQLPDFEVVKPVLEMRNLIPKAVELIDQIYIHYISKEGDLQEGIRQFQKLHHRANKYTSTVEDAVRRVRDND